MNLFLQYNIDHGQLEDKVMLKYILPLISVPTQGWPLAEIWVLCGFFMIYIVEEVRWGIPRGATSET